MTVDSLILNCYIMDSSLNNKSWVHCKILPGEKSIMKLVKLHLSLVITALWILDHPEFGELGSCRLIGCLGSVPLNDWLFMMILPQPGS